MWRFSCWRWVFDCTSDFDKVLALLPVFESFGLCWNFAVHFAHSGIMLTMARISLASEFSEQSCDFRLRRSYLNGVSCLCGNFVNSLEI
jgi:hypothetical protein